MKCRRCSFENMPGLARCGRCNSVLAPEAAVAVHPPRAGWTRRLRPLAYRLRPRALRARPRGARRFTFGEEGPLWAAALSVVPGLGHLVTGRTRAVRWLWPAWAGLLAVGLFLYGTTPGGVCLGLAVGLHGWMVCDAGGLNGRIEGWHMRVAASLVVFLFLLLVLYGGARRAAGHFVRGASVTEDAQAVGLKDGDFVLAWRRAYADAPPARGDVVLYVMPEAHGREWFARGGETVGRVLALSGDRVALRDDKVEVTTREGASLLFPLPWHVSEEHVEASIPPGKVFCLPPLHRRSFTPDGIQLSEQILPQVALVNETAVEGRVFMVWNPLWHRGRFSPPPPLNPGAGREPL